MLAGKVPGDKATPIKWLVSGQPPASKFDHRYKMFTGLETDHVLSLATNNRGALTAE